MPKAASAGRSRRSPPISSRRATGAQRLLDQAARAGDPVAAARCGERRHRQEGHVRRRARSARGLSARARFAAARRGHPGDPAAIGRSSATPTSNRSSRRWRASFDSRRSADAYAAVDEALAALERNASPKIVADWLVLQLVDEAAYRDHGRRSGGDRAGDRPQGRCRCRACARCASRCSTGRRRAQRSRRACCRPRPAARRTTRSAPRSATRRPARVAAIATAPINKLAFSQAGLPWKGHTDLLGHLTGSRRVAMMFWSEPLKVVLATVHVPLAAVPADAHPRRHGRDDRSDGAGAAALLRNPRIARALRSPV